MLRSIKVLGSAVYLPRRSVSAAELERRYGLPEGWVLQKTGVERRHYADGTEETNAKMGAAASRGALKQAGLSFCDVSLLINASATFQQPLPCTAALIQHELEETGIPCLDINATCLSFLTALELASSWLTVHESGRVLIVSSEIASIGLNWSEPEIACLFGDGAAAFVFEAGGQNDSRIIWSGFETFSEAIELCTVKRGGTAFPAWTYNERTQPEFLFSMQGPAIHRIAVKRFPLLVGRCLAAAGMSATDIDLFVPHQAGLLPIRMMARRLGFSEEQTVVTIAEHGNVIAASLPIAFHLARERQLIRHGQNVLFAGTAAGYSQGVILLRV